MFEIINKKLDIKNSKGLKIDFGCGANKESGFIGIDSRKVDGIDILSDLDGMSNIPNGCAIVVRTCHVIEHFEFNDLLRFLKECFRILSHTGYMIMYFPDLGKIDPKIDKDIAIKHVFGGRDYPENYHNSFWSKEQMKWFLDKIGFCNIEEVKYNGIHHPYKAPFEDWTCGLKMTITTEKQITKEEIMVKDTKATTLAEIKKYPIEYYMDKIKNNEHFKFSRYGDAEWMFYFKKGHANSDAIDGCKIVRNETDYNESISSLLAETIDNPKESNSYFYALQNMSLRVFGNRIPKLNWHNADVFHYASIRNELLPFLQLLREKNLVFIGGQYLRNIETLLPYNHFIEVPEKNCYVEKDRILRDIRDYGKPAIYIFQCSVLSSILIYELDIPESTLLDLGSLLDPLVGRLNRSYHKIIHESGILIEYIRGLNRMNRK